MSLEELYFGWLYDQVCGEDDSHTKLLRAMHQVIFRYSMAMDENRAVDGMELRERFIYEEELPWDDRLYLSGPCSVLEMLIALAYRCEIEIMDNKKYGNRTTKWFWEMLKNLDIDWMTNDRFDSDILEKRLHVWMSRKHGPHGEGAIFYIPNCTEDLRSVEIWYQLMAYLNYSEGD